MKGSGDFMDGECEWNVGWGGEVSVMWVVCVWRCREGCGLELICGGVCVCVW